MSQENSNPAEMQNRALNVLIMAANVGQAKGAYTLDEAAIIRDAIRVFEPPKQAQEAAPAPAIAQG